jgi:hypothetical protein
MSPETIAIHPFHASSLTFQSEDSNPSWGGKTMRPVLTILLVVASLSVFAETDTPKYDFSMSREDKIKLAESAAPPEVSRQATIYILEKKGYVKVRDGSNGFSCLVDRQTPLSSEPTCFDTEGSATTLLARLFVEQERGQGKTEAQIKTEVDEGYKTGRFKAPAKPGIVYMLSDSIYIAAGNQIVHSPPHLMFYAPYATEKDIGSPPRAANMPILIRAGQPDAYIIVIPSPVKHDSH